MNILITSPSLNLNENVSGVAAVTSFIIKSNKQYNYKHFEIGKRDSEKRNLWWLLKFLSLYLKWFLALIDPKTNFIHYNFPIDKRTVIRDVPLILMARFFRKKTVVHVHGGEYMHNTNVPGWAKRLLKQVFSGNDTCIFLSEEEKHFITSAYYCKRSFVLPNAVDIKDALRFERNEQDFKHLKFLFLGRICEEKGLNFIYDAFAKLLQQGFQISFTMAGKGPEEEEFVRKFSELLGNNFTFKGVVSGKEKNDLLKQTNIFLLPSFFEGLPISLLEAMSYAQIPIVTDVGAITKVVTSENNGLIVETKSAESIVKAITLLNSGETGLINMSKNARETIFNKFSPKIYIESLNKIYQSV